MNVRIKRIGMSLLVAIILITCVPIDVMALDIIGTSTSIDISFKEKDTIGDAAYKDVKTLTSLAVSPPGENYIKKDVKDTDFDFTTVLNLGDSSSIADIESAFNKLGIMYVSTVENSTISSGYSDELSVSKQSKILAGSGKFGYESLLGGSWWSTDDDTPTIVALRGAIGAGSKTNLEGMRAVIFLKQSDEGDTNLVLRYYLFDGHNMDNLPRRDTDRGVGVVAEYDLTPVIAKLKTINETDKTTSPITYHLYTELSKYAKQMLDEKQTKQQKLFDEYSTLTGNTNLASAIKEYQTKITKEPAKVIKTEGLTVYDNHALNLYYTANKKTGIFAGAENVVVPTNTTVDGSKEAGAIDLLQAVKSATEVTEKYKTSSVPYTDAGILSNAGIFYDLTRYRYGILSGAKIKTVNTSASDQREDNARLNALLIKDTKLASTTVNPKLYDQFPSIKKIAYNVPLEGFSDLMASIQLLEDYATVEKKYSGLSGSGNDIKHDVLDAYYVENSGKKVEEWTTPTPEMNTYVRTFKQIQQGLEWLGVKPWTPELVKICDMAVNKLKDFPLKDELIDYDTTSDTQPLKRFFDYKEQKLSKHYMTGVALSATYIPMQTNLYDTTSIRVLKDETWLRDFHMRYGFYRKALMMDTNVNAAVDGYITQSRDTTRPAMLRDLLEYNKDIVLYVDDNFYNTPEVAEMTGKAYERLSNTEQAGMGEESFSGKVDSLFNNSIEHILKTGPRAKYDGSTIDLTTEYGRTKPWIDFKGNMEAMFTNGILMSSGDGPTDIKNNEILKGLDQKEYSIKQSYALVSGIYRHKELATTLNNIANKPKSVFISSPTLFNVQNVPDEEFNSIYNYYMLRNLESSIGIDYKTTLDLDNPVYIDIYGNILTESGLVVIPAASNATLYPKNSYSPYTLGFMDLYSNGDNITTKNEEVKKRLTEFELDKDGKVWLQKNYKFNDVSVNPQNPSVADRKLLEVLFDNQVSILNKDSYDFKQRIWLITEVMRGAPLENINKEQEGIVGKRDVSKYGLYMSWKLDEIADMLLPTTNGNSLISMPNLAFMDGIEYVVLFAFKAMLVLFVIYIMCMVYLDSVGGKLGIKTLTKCITTVTVFIICISAIPSVISMSYNETNKIFLQDEIKYINLLNYEKDLEGREISAVGVTEPKSQTKLFLKLDTVSVPWYKVLQDVMFAPIGGTLDKLYEEELKDNMLYGYEGVQVVNDGVYIDVDDVFASSTIVYNNNLKFIYQNMTTSATASYFIPYYYFIDAMLSSNNIYNEKNGIDNITTKIQSDGSVKTMGMIGDYLLSEDFLINDVDPLGLYSLYNIDTNEVGKFVPPSFEDDMTIKKSMWYVAENYKAEDIASRIDEVYSHMRSYVAQNREMLGRVTDETFIKAMMLDLSMKYNNVFKIPAAKGIEVFSIDSRDLIRLSLSDKNTAVINSSQSFGKFVYEESGGFGVILTAILLGVFFLASVVKPALVIFLCGILIYNVLIKSMINRDKGKTVEGLLYILSIMIILNSTYALLLKLSMSLPSLGLSPLISIIGQIAIQAGYLWLVFKIVGAIFKDVANMGYNIFHTGVLAMTGRLSGAASNMRDRAIYSDEQRNYMESAKLKSEEKSTTGPEGLRQEMAKRDKKRIESQEDTVFMEEVFGKNEDKDK